MRLTLVFIALALFGCSENYGLGLARLHIEAMKGDNSAVAGFDSQNCTRIPVLLGSRIEEDFPIAPPLSVKVDANRDEVRVSFAGAQNGPVRVVSEAQLRSGFSEELAVTSTSGESFKVFLSSSCPTTAPSN